MKYSTKIIFLVMIVLFLIFNISLFVTLDNRNKKILLEDVKLKEELGKDNTFAIMLETSDGTYKESDSNVWPTNMAYNSDKSGCIDASGNKIDNALSFDSTNNLATVSTTGTSYCYLYFDLDKTGPVITNVEDAGDGKITFTVEDELNEVSEYCVNQNVEDTSDCTWYDAIEGTQTTGRIVTESGTYYIHVSDTLGNIGHSSAVTIEVSKPAGETILENPSTGLNPTMEGGLYRFQGTSVNNYICFGTSTKSTCTGDTDKYMYRIIGINSSGQLKLIKNEALASIHVWHSSYTSDTTWPNSDLYGKLNGSTFYTNTTYVPTSWQSKIATTCWKYGDNTNVNVTASSLYTTEQAWTSTTSAKIGLMYMHDYVYAYQSGGLNCSTSFGSYTTCKTAWLHLSNCDSGAPYVSEWTMSRFSSDFACSVSSSGFIDDIFTMDTTFSVRPVFYLTKDVQFVGGTGTSADPFIIS